MGCLFAPFLVQGSFGASKPTPTPTLEDILKKISQFERENPTPQRELDGRYLIIMVKRQDFMLVKQEEVDALIKMLSSDDESIRGTAAAAIGYLGPTGRKAEPALLSALARVDCINADHTSASIIRLTLTRIGRVAPKRDCALQ
jgi:hypothetical protein